MQMSHLFSKKLQRRSLVGEAFGFGESVSLLGLRLVEGVAIDEVEGAAIHE